MITMEKDKQFDALISFMNDNREAKGVLMATLLEAQNLYGYISEDVIKLIDRVLGVPASRIDNVVNFYSFLNNKPGDYSEKVEKVKSVSGDNVTLKDVKSDDSLVDNLGKYESVADFVSAGGFRGLAKALSMDSDELNKHIKSTGYKGRGDGGFVTGLKMELVAGVEASDKGVICNADIISRSLDSKIIKENPYKLIEAILIAGYGVKTNKGYIYTEDINEMNLAIDAAYSAGILGESVLGSDFSFDIEVRYANDPFISPREVETDDFIERDLNIHRENRVEGTSFGVSGRPREYFITDKCIGCTKCAKNCPVSCIKGELKTLHIIDPDKCISCGMCMNVCPTAAVVYTNFVANVETLINIPDLVLSEVDTFKAVGNPKNPGTKIISIEGDVNSAGVVEVATDVTLGDIIKDYAGGSKGEVIGVRIGGPIGTILTADALEKPVDFEAPLKYGLISGVYEGVSLYVIAGETSLLDIAKESARYSVSESCGKCTPCREGTKRLEETLNNMDSNRDDALAKLESLASVISSASLCSLGQLAPTTISSILANFKDKL